MLLIYFLEELMETFSLLNFWISSTKNRCFYYKITENLDIIYYCLFPYFLRMKRIGVLKPLLVYYATTSGKLQSHESK